MPVFFILLRILLLLSSSDIINDNLVSSNTISYLLPKGNRLKIRYKLPKIKQTDA